jgi:predicted metal-dependent peptidase
MIGHDLKLEDPEIKKLDSEVMKRGLLAFDRAAVAVTLTQPFHSGIIMRLIPVPTLRVPTNATNGKHLFWNPLFWSKLTREQGVSELCHEAGHVMRKHMLRSLKLDKSRANKAGDYEINIALSDAEKEQREQNLHAMKMDEKTFLLDEKFRDWTFEEIYRALPEEDESEKGKEKGRGCFEDYPFEEGETVASVEAAIDSVVRQAEQAARSRGKMPGEIAAWLQECRKYRADFSHVVEPFLVTATNKGDYNWMRPNRRYLSLGYHLPSLVRDRRGRVVIFIDSSGSVGDPELVEFLSLVNGILQRLRIAELKFGTADIRVNEVKSYTLDDLPIERDKLPKISRGGTDFRPAFKWVEEDGERPDCLLYLSDGEGPFPEKAPPYPVLWVLVGNAQDAPWGITCRLKV